MSKVAAAIQTVLHKASFNFRNWKQGQEGLTRLQALLTSEKLTASDITVTKDKEGKTELDLYQRNAVNLEIEIPLVSSLIVEGTLTPNQLDHLQALLNATIEKAQQGAVDEAIHNEVNANGEYINIKSWQAVLEAPYKQRTAQVKVTEDMLKAAVTPFNDFLAGVGSSQKGIDLISNLALKKFQLSLCVKVKLPVLERIQARIVEWFETLEDKDKHTHSAVISLWATNLEKAIKPETNDEIDEDMI